MDYNVFYAYQSDIPKELNETFIENALNEAAKKIGSAKVKIVKGFKGTSGQKPLAQTMFDQSESSDIFIGDVTYTSSRNTHVERTLFRFKKKEYLTRIPGKIKQSPNPNVLLETGYSWGKKDYDRTILIMNQAFGIPEDFPVDMKHIRFPIYYNLNSEDLLNEEKCKKIYSELVNDLSKALKDALTTTQEYHKRRFHPFRIHQDWKSEEFNNTYVAIDEIVGIITQLRTALAIPGNPQRIVGPKKSGKTRLAYQLFKKVNTNLKRDDAIEKVLYYDLSNSDYPYIEKQVMDIADLNQDKVVIIDNCNARIHKRLCNDF